MDGCRANSKISLSLVECRDTRGAVYNGLDGFSETGLRRANQRERLSCNMCVARQQLAARFVGLGVYTRSLISALYTPW